MQAAQIMLRELEHTTAREDMQAQGSAGQGREGQPSATHAPVHTSLHGPMGPTAHLDFRSLSTPAVRLCTPAAHLWPQSNTLPPLLAPFSRLVAAVKLSSTTLASFRWAAQFVSSKQLSTSVATGSVWQELLFLNSDRASTEHERMIMPGHGRQGGRFSA